MKNTALERLIYGLLGLLISFSFSSFKIIGQTTVKKDTVSSPTYRIKTIIVDAGHGKMTNGVWRGASGSYSQESIVTLQIARKLQAAIEKEIQDVKVVMTRTDDNDVSLQRRSDIANENKGDLFISIHCNSLPDRVSYAHGRRIHVPDRSGKGVLLLVYGFHRTKEEEKAIKQTRIEEDSELNTELDPNDPESLILMNEYKRRFRKQSIHLANLINTEFVETDGRHSDGVIEQGVLVLCHSAMPSVLVETGFINNPDDEAYLNSEAGQNEIVASIVRAIQNYKKEVEQGSEPN
jgi:N-acetylmuramoyl-L-alanine amidase